MKRLMILALAVLAVPVYADNQTHEAYQRENSRNPSRQTADASIQQNSSAPLKNEPQHHIDADAKVVSLPAKDWEDKATFFVNLALAIAGFLAIGVGICTLRMVKRQTDLQEIAYTQCVKIENWEASAISVAPYGTNPYGEVRIGFDIVNGSDFPLTMKNANIAIYGNTIFNPGDNVFLAPRAPYRVNSVIEITMANYQCWELGIITVPIEGNIPYVGVLRTLTNYPLRGLLILGRDAKPCFRNELSTGPIGQPKQA